MTRAELENILVSMASERPLFYSEADFQHELAWRIREVYKNANIRLEVPLVEWKEDNDKEDGRKRLDIRVDINNHLIGIELKYKKTELDIELNGERYRLKRDSAQDVSRYDFLKDITRLEGFVAKNKGARGYAIIISNESLFWEKGRSKNDIDFLIYEGRVLPVGTPLQWASKASKGTTKGREEPLLLKNSYQLHWKEYSKIPGPKGALKYLLVEVVN